MERDNLKTSASTGNTVSPASDSIKPPTAKIRRVSTGNGRKAGVSKSISVVAINTDSDYFFRDIIKCRITTMRDDKETFVYSLKYKPGSNDSMTVTSSSDSEPIKMETEPNASGLNSITSPLVGPFTNWQVAKTNLKERFAFLLNNEIFADVSFNVGAEKNQQRFRAHRLVLSASSVVFASMFNENWSFKVDEIEIPDAKPEAFYELLRHLYTDESCINLDNVGSVLYVAKKYDVLALKQKCVQFIKDSLNSENVFTFLMQAKELNEASVISACYRVIGRNTAVAVLGEGFLSIDQATLCTLLKDDMLSITEVQLFDAICRWSIAECGRQSLPVNPTNQQAVLGEVPTLVRYPLMTIEEFSSSVALSGLLAEKDVISIYHYLASPKDSKPPITFSTNQRVQVLLVTFFAFRFTSIRYGWTHSGTPDRINCDSNVDLTGFELFSSKLKDRQYSIYIRVIETVTSQELHRSCYAYKCKGTTKVFSIDLNKPVKLSAFVKYTAIITTSGPLSYYGAGGKKDNTIVLGHGDKITVTYEDVEDRIHNGTTMEQGQIAGILVSV